MKAASEIQIDAVITGLTNPVAITHAGDGSGRLFITQISGQILIFDGNQILPESFLDIGSLASTGGERGLFSVAFHPEYSNNGFLFVNYTDINGDTAVARYSVSADPNIVDTDSASILFAVPQPFENHNGGQLQFGPDGFLYIGMGDGGSGGDPSNNAQTLNNLLGKILRINVDGGIPYSIPADNPFLGEPGASEEIWALGLRNPWRFSFDRLNGDLFIADVGQSNREEINFQPVDSQGGENYGWRLMEGSACFNPSVNCSNGILTQPILEYDHSLGCSVTGGIDTAVMRIRDCWVFIFTATSVRVASGVPFKIMPAIGQQLYCWIPTFRLQPSARMKTVKSIWLISLPVMEQFIASPKLLILLLHQEEEIVEVAAAVVLSQAPPIGFLLNPNRAKKLDQGACCLLFMVSCQKGPHHIYISLIESL